MKVSLQLDQDMEIGEPEFFFEGDYVNVWGRHMISSLMAGFFY